MNEVSDAQAIARLCDIACAKLVDGRVSRSTPFHICRNGVDDAFRPFDGRVHRTLVPDVCRYKHCTTGSLSIGAEGKLLGVTRGDADHRTFMDEALDDVTAEETGSAEDGYQRHIQTPLP